MYRRKTKWFEHPLFIKATETALGIAITLLISSGLIGGGAYFLITEDQDAQKIVDFERDLERQNSELELGIEMAVIANSGWYSGTTQMDQMEQMVRIWSDQIGKDTLDPAFKKELDDWCWRTLSQLSSEKGRIDGYTFSLQSVQFAQDGFSSAYNSTINEVSAFCDLSTDWHKLSKDQQEERFDLLQKAWFETDRMFGLSETHFTQFFSSVALEQSAVEAKRQELKKAYSRYTNRLYLSYIGLTIGLILFGVLILGLILTRQQPTSNASRQRSKPISSYRRRTRQLKSPALQRRKS